MRTEPVGPASPPLRVLGLVPARGGSKGVPRKNLRVLGDRPLIAWTAAAALASRRLARTVLTTDDPEIAEAGRRAGLEAPFLRPAELGADDTPMLPVVAHALAWLEERGDRYDAVCLLQPTVPFRRAEDIDGCIELLERSGADAVVSVRRIPEPFHPAWAYVSGARGELRLAVPQDAPPPSRQGLSPAVHRDGAVYVTRRDVVLQRRSLYGDRLVGYAMPAEAPWVNVDDPADWDRAEALVRGGAVAGALAGVA